jgi:hypothetical protein
VRTTLHTPHTHTLRARGRTTTHRLARVTCLAVSSSPSTTCSMR